VISVGKSVRKNTFFSFNLTMLIFVMSVTYFILVYEEKITKNVNFSTLLITHIYNFIVVKILNFNFLIYYF